MTEYNHLKIEKKWQKEWEKNKIYQVKDNSKKPKFYSLIEFPYPSGSGLHVGHIRSNTAMDIISRKRRMEGYNVLYPIGWDAFGLPTENYAIKTGIHPTKVTKTNTDTFRRQLKALGFSFDWSREINTTDPKYYKWTQWIFLQFYKKGLAYKSKTEINWCPVDKIGLANEEVIDGMCERCGNPTEKREKEQWMLAITKYAERLDKDLDTVNYLEKIKIQQRNWIGKKNGAVIKFAGEEGSIDIFTTRPDTIFGATFVAIAGEKDKFTGRYVTNPATKEKIPVWEAEYVMSEIGTGAIMAVPAHDERDFEFAKKYNLPIRQVIEPSFFQTTEPGKIREDLPIEHRDAIIAIVKHWSEEKYIALRWKKVAWTTFITGGIEKNQTPEEAARMEIKEETGYINLKLISNLGRLHGKFYHVPKGVNRYAHSHTMVFELQDNKCENITEEEKEIHDVIWLTKDELKKNLTADSHRRALELINGQEVYSGDGILINSGKFDGLDSQIARKEIIKFVGGKEKTTFKLRDWIFSRQRYWGEPIPLIYCMSKGSPCSNTWVPVPEKDLPVVLPKVAKYKPTDNGESPLADIKSWVNVKCPKCKGRAKRETDTMPNWAGSSWYYLRYTDPKNNKEFASKKNLKYWTPVDWYNGGMEHTTLHLLYSRFWHKFLYDLKLVPTSEPYMKRTSHGLILAEEGEKMSKSKGNVVNPDDLIKTYGADTLRLYEMFMGPFDQSVSWSTNSMIGPRRFLEKVWRIGIKFSQQKNSPALAGSGSGHGSNFSVPKPQKLLHKTIKKVSEDIEDMRFNTAVSSMMVLVNEMDKGEISKEDYKKFLQILAPFAPHIAEELWSMLGEKKSINLSSWPKWDADKITDEEMKIAVQINGKVRAELMISTEDTEENIKNQALADETIERHIKNSPIKKVIYVKNRLINIVL